MRYLAEGNYSEAIIAFTAAIEIDPKQALAYEKLAKAYIAIGDMDSARVILEGGIQACNETDSLHRLLAEFSDATSAEEESSYFAENVISPSELTIGGMPFWNLTVADIASVYPNGEYLDLPADDNREIEYDAYTIGESGRRYHCFFANVGKQGEPTLGRFLVQYHGFLNEQENAALGYETEVRGIRCGQTISDTLEKIGLQQSTIEEIKLSNYGNYLLNVYRDSFEERNESSNGHKRVEIAFFEQDKSVWLTLQFVNGILESIGFLLNG